MAKHMIHNDELTILVDDLGAELHSIVNNTTKQEYLWQGDSAYWCRRSPVLFPIVGNLRNKEYTYHGTTYSITQHGFARDMEFVLIKQSPVQLTFQLESTEETYAIYPFHFTLQIIYTLEGSNLRVEWNVINTDTKTMYFSIGGHPGFNCPLHTSDHQTDYYLNFYCDELKITNIDANGLAMSKQHALSLTDGLLPITEHLFDEDALVIEHAQTHHVSLLNPDRTPYLSVHFDAPLFGVWSPAKKQAPFICIEPWYGRCDSADFTGELKDREWGNTLEAGKNFNAFYTIEVHNF